MKRIVFVLTAAMATGIWAQAIRPAAKTKVEVVALQVAKPHPEKKMQSLVGGGPPGTSLHIRLTRKDKYFVELDEEASKLLSFSDEKGTDLSKARTRRFGRGWLGHWTQISKDGHSCIFEARSGLLPAAGARELRLKANLVMVCGAGEKTAEQKNLVLKKGSRLAAGPVRLEIKSVKQIDRSGMEMLLETESKASFVQIKKLRFIGPDGKEIKHQVMGSGRMGFAGRFTYYRSFGLAKKVASVSVEVTYFEKVDRLSVPLNVKTGVGL